MPKLKHFETVFVFLYNVFLAIPIYILLIMSVGLIVLIKELFSKTYIFAIKKFSKNN